MSDVYNSKLAKLIAKFHKTDRWAITIGQRAYYSVSEELVTERWRNHENRHKEQYKELGFIRFITLYLYYSMRYGYYKNPFEIDARNNEVKGLD